MVEYYDFQNAGNMISGKGLKYWETASYTFYH